MELPVFGSASIPSFSPNDDPSTRGASQSMPPSDPPDWEGAQPRSPPPRPLMDIHMRLTEKKEEEGRGRKRKRDGKKGSRKGKGRATSPISLSSSASSLSRSVSSSRSAGSSSPSRSYSHPRRSSRHSRSYKRHSTKRRRSKTPAHMIFWNQVKDSSDETVEALRKVRPEVLRMLGNEGFLKLDYELADLQFKYNQLKKKYGKLRGRLDKQTPFGQTGTIAPALAFSPPSIQYQPIQLENGQQLLMLPAVEPAVIRPPGYQGFWTSDEWMATKSSNKAKPSNSTFLLNADGSPLSDSEWKAIRRTLRDVLTFLGKNIEFRLQSSLNDKQFRDHTIISLESAHPVLAQCEQHWKVAQLVVENYKSWLESFLQAYGVGKLSAIDIPKVLTGAWGRNRFGSYLRLTPDQIEEYQPAHNSSLTPPPPAQPRRSKYALTLATNQSRNLEDQPGPRPLPLLPSHPLPSSSIIPPPPPPSMFRNPAEMLHQPAPESEPIVDLDSIILIRTAAPVQGALQVTETSLGTLATTPPSYQQPFSQTIELQPFTRHRQEQLPQINAPSAASSMFPPPVQESAIPGIDPALVQESIRAGCLTGNNESLSPATSSNIPPIPPSTISPTAPLDLPPTPPSAAPPTPPPATSSNLPLIAPSTISSTVPPDLPPTLPSAAPHALSPTTPPAMLSITLSATPPISSTTESTNTKVASSSAPVEMPAPPTSIIPIEYNKMLWSGKVKDFKGKKNVYRPRINDNCPENLAGTDWAMNKKHNKDTRNKNQDFAEYWNSISVDDKTLWFEKAKSLGYAIGNEPSRKNKNKKSD